MKIPSRQILIEQKIYLIRSQRVMLDMDLAEIYGVTTKRFNEQVKRNLDRFPKDFMFHLTEEEAKNLRSQFATSSLAHGGRRYLPHAFTEHGALMAANVLNSPIAVKASIQVIRAFLKLRYLLAEHKDLARKLKNLEKKYDAKFRIVFDAIRELMNPPSPPPEPKHRRIGFHVKE